MGVASMWGVVEENDLRIPTFHRLTVRLQKYCLISPHVSFHRSPLEEIKPWPCLQVLKERQAKKEICHQAGPRGRPLTSKAPSTVSRGNTGCLRAQPPPLSVAHKSSPPPKPLD